jgi:hypothetical protein
MFASKVFQALVVEGLIPGTAGKRHHCSGIAVPNSESRVFATATSPVNNQRVGRKLLSEVCQFTLWPLLDWKRFPTDTLRC